MQVYVCSCGAGVYACHSGMMLPAIFELSAEDSGMHHGRQHLAQFKSGREKLVVRAVAHALPQLTKGPYSQLCCFRTWPQDSFEVGMLLTAQPEARL